VTAVLAYLSPTLRHPKPFFNPLVLNMEGLEGLKMICLVFEDKKYYF